MRYVAGKAKNWIGARSAARIPASRTPSGRRPRQLTTSSTTVTSPGRPRVVARWGRNPVPKMDAILKNGQPSSQVLSYEIRLTRPTTSPAPAITSPTSRIHPSPPPATTRMVAIDATRRSPVRRIESPQTTRARTAAKSALLAK